MLHVIAVGQNALTTEKKTAVEIKGLGGLGVLLANLHGRGTMRQKNCLGVGLDLAINQRLDLVGR